MMMYSCVPAGVGTPIKFQEQGSYREDIDAGYTQIRKKKIEDRLERHQTRELDHMEQLNNQIDVLNKLNKEQLKFKYQQDKLAKLSKHRFYEQFEKQGQKDNEKLQEFARVLQSFDKFQENFEKESAEIKEEGTRLTRDLSIVYVVRKASFDFCIDSNFTLYYQNLQKLAKNMQMEHKSMTENHIRFQARFNKHVGSRSSEKTIDCNISYFCDFYIL